MTQNTCEDQRIAVDLLDKEEKSLISDFPQFSPGVGPAFMWTDTYIILGSLFKKNKMQNDEYELRNDNDYLER